jgi:hypothetical protein
MVLQLASAARTAPDSMATPKGSQEARDSFMYATASVYLTNDLEEMKMRLRYEAGYQYQKKNPRGSDPQRW